MIDILNPNANILSVCFRRFWHVSLWGCYGTNWSLSEAEIVWWHEEVGIIFQW